VNKTEWLDRYARDSESRLLLGRVLDQEQRCRQRGIPTHTAFLSPAEQAVSADLLMAAAPGAGVLFGGYEGAERTVCVFLPDWQEAEDWDAADELAAIECAYPPTGAELTHRDLLGGLMGIGLTRERVGDILVGEKAAQLVCLRDAAPIILSQFDQAGRYRLKLREIPLGELAPAPAEVKLIHDTVSTLRLDAVLSSGFSLARGKAADAVTGGRVSLNHRECLKPDRAVAQGDVLTCRGLGKCVLKTVGGQSRKGRIIIEIERYL